MSYNPHVYHQHHGSRGYQQQQQSNYGRSNVASSNEGNIRLPQSLERILANMDRRVDEIGLRREEIDDHILGKPLKSEVVKVTENPSASIVIRLKTSIRNRKRKVQKKKAKIRRRLQAARTAFESKNESKVDQKEENEEVPDNVIIEYIPEDLPVDRNDPFFSYFRSVAQHFRPSHSSGKHNLNLASKYGNIKGFGVGMKIRDRTLLEDEDDQPKGEEEKGTSKKQMKKMTRLSVPTIKSLSPFLKHNFSKI
ncbi:hypothetical protein ACOME3_006364 [Neoechinorhynchus agilis]